MFRKRRSGAYVNFFFYFKITTICPYLKITVMIAHYSSFPKHLNTCSRERLWYSRRCRKYEVSLETLRYYRTKISKCVIQSYDVYSFSFFRGVESSNFMRIVPFFTINFSRKTGLFHCTEGFLTILWSKSSQTRHHDTQTFVRIDERRQLRLLGLFCWTFKNNIIPSAWLCYLLALFIIFWFVPSHTKEAFLASIWKRHS